MRTEFLLKNLKESLFVHTKTEAEAIRVLTIAHNAGFAWSGGDSLLAETNWSAYEEEQVYWINPNREVLYGDTSNYRGRKIIDSTQIVDKLSLYLPSDLKVGDAIHTPTLEEYERVLKILDGLGYTWLSGSKLEELNNFPTYTDQTCLFIRTERDITHSGLSYFTENDAKRILKSEQVIKNLDIEVINKPNKMNEQITLYRRGFFVTENFTPTQCTTEGHEAYTYLAELKCDYKLDDNGFLIDHSLLHRSVENYIRNTPMYSCEVMSRNLTHLLVDSAVGHGCALKEISFTIIPVRRDQLEYKQSESWIAKDPSSINYQMPANAIYKLVVDENYKSVISPEDLEAYKKMLKENVPVVPDNVFVGMRVIKGAYWDNSNKNTKAGEIGEVTQVNSGGQSVKVYWDSSGELDTYYNIYSHKSELYISHDSPTKEEYEENKPNITIVSPTSVEVGMEVVYARDVFKSGLKEGADIGTVILSKDHLPKNEHSDYIYVHWRDQGLLKHDIVDEHELAIYNND